MTLDYKKMFLIVTEEAVVKGHFTFIRFFRHPKGCVFYCPDPDGENKKAGSRKAAQHEYHSTFHCPRQAVLFFSGANLYVAQRPFVYFRHY